MTQSQESTVKPLFGFRALMADLADWIRKHRMTLGFVLFITLFNVGMQLVCGIKIGRASCRERVFSSV